MLPPKLMYRRRRGGSPDEFEYFASEGVMDASPNTTNDNLEQEKPLFTGRYFMILDKDTSPLKARSILEEQAGMRMASISDFTNRPFNEGLIPDADALLYEDLGIALVGAPEDQVSTIMSEPSGYHFVPELIAYIPDDVPQISTVPSLWSISAVRADLSQYSGSGIKLAILDTGFDHGHPDFATRNIVAESFIGSGDGRDGHGHGTHCAGTACGYMDMNNVRYGVASSSDIYIGKVLRDNGNGPQAWVLNGMKWAVEQGCKVISMSLGSPVFSGEHREAYERLTQDAWTKGAIIVAAAGNQSRRSTGVLKAINCPANCADVIAVGAIDSQNAVADFSCRAMHPGQDMDFTAPGVGIYSSWPKRAGRYKTISGTSMATPHVAGVLALIWEKQGAGATPQSVVDELRSLAVTNPAWQIQDVGAGLACAP